MSKHLGKLIVVHGCMFSGKSSELIRLAERSRWARKKVLTFNHTTDIRYGQKLIASHNGEKLDAILIHSPREIKDYLDKSVDVVVIDEGQFFDDSLIDVAQELNEQGITVIVGGLDTDFRAEPFHPMPTLIVMADEDIALTAICVECGENANRTQRLVNGLPAKYTDPIILVGADELYEARCRACHEVPGKP
ncbi:MAG: Thymidine kinase [Candidatus Daviesbacteria bacterium GW2011_GWA1_36_8]|uniref:Thymidine kinase n=2 Tax=Microgenomates group TaxID=1794810 RepID=A0A0G0FAS8_9BACT|nr:MAG: Thymidine kinase [Candidatus Daviesbacteria bacterium GW2011_GWA1_36_8]